MEDTQLAVARVSAQIWTLAKVMTMTILDTTTTQHKLMSIQEAIPGLNTESVQQSAGMGIFHKSAIFGLQVKMGFKSLTICLKPSLNSAHS